MTIIRYDGRVLKALCSFSSWLNLKQGFSSSCFENPLFRPHLPTASKVLCAVSLWKLCMCQLCLSPVLASLGRPACPHYRQRQAEFQKEIWVLNSLRKFTFFSVGQDKIQRRAKRRKYWSMSWEIRKLEGNISNKLSHDSSFELS